MPERRPRITRESRTVAVMIYDYCRAHHAVGKLCNACTELKEYALKRLDNCPFGDGKTVCSKCPVHCYRPDMREKIRIVMLYAGPRMTYRHPLMAVQHLLDKRRKKPIN